VERNYELTTETKVVFGITLYRIRAIKDIPTANVKSGELGGFIQSTETLFGNAQVYGDAQVAGNARVYGDAWVAGNAQVDCKDAIASFLFSAGFIITITRKNVQIGCTTFKRSEALKLTKEQAIAKGLPKEHYEAYRLIVRGACKLVKRKV
jgi:hypothetical protein